MDTGLEAADSEMTALQHSYNLPTAQTDSTSTAEPSRGDHTCAVAAHEGICGSNQRDGEVPRSNGATAAASVAEILGAGGTRSDRWGKNNEYFPGKDLFTYDQSCRVGRMLQGPGQRCGCCAQNHFRYWHEADSGGDFKLEPAGEGICTNPQQLCGMPVIFAQPNEHPQ